MQEIVSIDLVVNFLLREEILVAKLMGRRICPSCNNNYNVTDINTSDGYVMKPLLPKKDIHKCDRCNVKLIIRDDDKESTIRDRMKVYKDQTEPILKFYKEKTKVKVIDFEAKKGVDDYPKIKEIVEKGLQK
jgi:adenylate kinase